uniref:DUF1725 domain-containing protein n=1 Tax=Sus scrofa TaxID=9823 RepID=A0A8D1IRH6_PIG
MHLHFHCSSLHNSQDMETTQMSIDRYWIRKKWYIDTMEYYLAIKKNEIMPFAATWMELETLILSEVSQKEKDKYHMIYDVTYLEYNKGTNESFHRKDNHGFGE